MNSPPSPVSSRLGRRRTGYTHSVADPQRKVKSISEERTDYTMTLLSNSSTTRRGFLIAELARIVRDKRSPYQLTIVHDNWCRSLQTGRAEDCTCTVEYRLAQKM